MILAHVPHCGNRIAVKIIDVFTYAGRKLAVVEALQGQPFTQMTHGGPADTSSAHVPVDILQDIHVEPDQANDSKPANLLDLALAQARPQWPTGELIWLVKDRAYLKNENGVVKLRTLGYKPGLTIFCLDLVTGEWKVSNEIVNYPSWVDGYRANQK